MQEQVIFVGFSITVCVSQSVISVMDFTNYHNIIILYTFQSSVCHCMYEYASIDNSKLNNFQ